MKTWSYGVSLSLTSWGQMYNHLRLCVLFFRLTTAKPPLYSPAVCQSKRKHNHHQTSTFSCQPHPGPSSILSSDTSVTPWGGLDLYESSFTTISLLPSPPPPTSPTPQVTTSTPFRGKQNEDSAVNCEVPTVRSVLNLIYSIVPIFLYLFSICLCRWSWQGVTSETERFASVSSGSSFPPASTARHHQPQFFSELHLLFLWATCAPFGRLPSPTNQKPHAAFEIDKPLKSQSKCLLAFFCWTLNLWFSEVLYCFVCAKF